MTEIRLFTISFRWLLRLYAIIPASLLMIAVDAHFFGGALRAVLPKSPDNLRFLNILIVFPHIVASASSFIDREYLKEYRTRLLWGIPLIGFLTFGIPFLFGNAFAALVYGTYTIYHVLTQQIGITALMMGRPPDRMFKIWKWLIIALAVAIYYLTLWNVRTPQGTLIALAAVMAVAAVIGGVAARGSKTGIGEKYLWANSALIAGIIASYAAGYPFFVILMPRLIHDLSGFFFYVTHDANRNAGRARNAYYRLFAFTGVPIFVLSPVLAILVANGLTQGAHAWPWISFALLALGYFHYYTEGFMWKRGTAHRRAVPTPAL